MAKVLTRTLRYRFNALPEKMKQSVLSFYSDGNPSYVSYADTTLFEKELSSIVMQLISTILRKANQGKLFISKVGTSAYEVEKTWEKEDRLKRWFRSLDSNLLSCDDCIIIEKILKRVGVWESVHCRKSSTLPRWTLVCTIRTCAI